MLLWSAALPRDGGLHGVGATDGPGVSLGHLAGGPRAPGRVASLPPSRHGARLHPNGRWR